MQRRAARSVWPTLWTTQVPPGPSERTVCPSCRAGEFAYHENYNGATNLWPRLPKVVPAARECVTMNHDSYAAAFRVAGSGKSGITMSDSVWKKVRTSLTMVHKVVNERFSCRIENG